MKFLFAILILLQTCFAIGQEEEFEFPQDTNNLYLGFCGGYIYAEEYNVLLQNKQFYCINQIDKTFGDGNYLGINIKYLITETENSFNSISFRLLLENISTKGSVPADDCPIYDSSMILMDTAKTIMESITSYMFLTADLIYGIHFFESFPIGISTGLYCSYILNNNFQQLYSLDDSTKYTFQKNSLYKLTNNNRSMEMYNDEIEDIQNLQVGIKAKIIYEYKLSDSFLIIPEIGTAIAITNVVENQDWRINYWFAGINILYKIK